MKYLLVLAVVFAGVWFWRRNRAPVAPPAQPRRPPAAVAMVACRHCGVHLPATEAVAGALGPYCCTEHLRLAEPSRHKT